MTLYSFVLFAHITAVLAMFACLSLEVLSLFHLRRASTLSEVQLWIEPIPSFSRIALGSLLVILLSGVYLTIQMSGFGLAWLKVTIAAFLLMAPLGAVSGRRIRYVQRLSGNGKMTQSEILDLLRHPFLKVSLALRIAVFLGIVLLMTAKPGLPESLAIAGGSVVLGLASAVLIPSGRSTLSAPKDRPDSSVRLIYFQVKGDSLNSSSTSAEIGNIALVASFIVLAAALGYRYIGLPPVIIVGGSGLIGLLAWSASYLKRPTSPEIILPWFLFTVAALEVHMMEEYLTGFAPAMSRLFNITWTERGFLIVFAFVGPALYALTAIGLFYRIRFAGFLAWFIFIGPGVAEFTHFIFPLLKPDINPEIPQKVAHLFPNGVYISDLPNYYIHATGTYYFAGMYTAILPMIPGIYAIYKLLKEDRKERQSSFERMKNFSKAA